MRAGRVCINLRFNTFFWFGISYVSPGLSLSLSMFQFCPHSSSFASGHSLSLFLLRLFWFFSSQQSVRLFPTCNCLNAANKYWPRILTYCYAQPLVCLTLHTRHSIFHSTFVALFSLRKEKRSICAIGKQSRSRTHYWGPGYVVRALRTNAGVWSCSLFIATYQKKNHFFFSHNMCSFISSAHRFRYSWRNCDLENTCGSVFFHHSPVTSMVRPLAKLFSNLYNDYVIISFHFVAVLCLFMTKSGDFIQIITQTNTHSTQHT